MGARVRLAFLGFWEGSEELHRVTNFWNGEIGRNKFDMTGYGYSYMGVGSFTVLKLVMMEWKVKGYRAIGPYAKIVNEHTF